MPCKFVSWLNGSARAVGVTTHHGYKRSWYHDVVVRKTAAGPTRYFGQGSDEQSGDRSAPIGLACDGGQSGGLT